jgi:stage II sporulation protein GA (sporulation sigma-E factor processing peptidase)
MVLLGFWESRKLLRVLLVFFCASAALGGVVLALQLLGTGGLTLENGVLYTGFDLRLLLVTVLVCYGVLSCVFRRAARHSRGGGELTDARLFLGEKSLCLSVLLDTGNTLTEPMNNRPVMVAEAQALAPLLPSEIDPADPVSSMARLAGDDMGRRFRLLPYRAVGVAHGLLLAVRTDKVVLGDRELKGLLVALSPTPVSDGGGYQALMGDLEGINWEASA